MAHQGHTELPRPTWGLEEARALARVQGRMFGACVEPLKLARYHILRKVATGGFGVVYEGYDPELDRKVAVKLLHTGSDDADDAVTRLLREARALARLTHAAVLPVFDVGHLDATAAACPNAVFMVTELVDGTTLREWLTAGQRPWREVLRVFRTAGEGLAAAHDAGIIHRDFKPANVLIGADGRVRVADFGLARWTSSEEHHAELRATDSTTSRADMDITEPGTVMGTPRYMAPEQHDGSTMDARTDQYAFCIALHEALHATPPFGGSSLEALCTAKAKGLEARPPQNSRIPARLHRVLRRGLSPRPEDRFESMPDLLRALAMIERRRRRGLAILSGVAAGAVAVGTLAISRANAEHGLCSDTDSLEAEWNEEIRRRVLERLSAGIDGPLADRIVTSVDDYVQDWIAARQQTCHAAVGTGDTAIEAIRRRLACFEYRREELRGILEVFETADRSTARQGEAIVAMLPDPATCTHDEELATHFLPVEAEQAEAVAHARAHMLALRALRLSGRYEEARAEGLEALRFAEMGSHPPTRARALFALAWVETALLELDDAEHHVRAGWEVTEANGLGELSLRAVIDLADNLRVQERHEEARHMLDLAEAKARFLREGAGPRSDVAFQRAALLAATSQTRDAVPLFERAVEMRVELFGPRHLAVARTRMHFARLLAARAELVRAQEQLDEAEAIIATDGTALPVAMVIVRAEAANLERLSGRHEEALGALLPICEELRDAGPAHRLERVRCLLHAGEAASVLGRSEVASASYDAARSTALEVLGPDRPSVWAAERGLAAATAESAKESWRP